MLSSTDFKIAQESALNAEKHKLQEFYSLEQRMESKKYYDKCNNILSIAACILFVIYTAISAMCGINCFGNLSHMRSLSDTDLGVTILFIVLMLFTFTVSIPPGYNFISSIFVKDKCESPDSSVVGSCEYNLNIAVEI